MINIVLLMTLSLCQPTFVLHYLQLYHQFTVILRWSKINERHGGQSEWYIRKSKGFEVRQTWTRSPTLLLPCSGLQEKILTFLNLSFISYKIRMVSPILYGSIGLKLQRNWGQFSAQIAPKMLVGVQQPHLLFSNHTFRVCIPLFTIFVLQLLYSFNVATNCICFLWPL